MLAVDATAALAGVTELNALGVGAAPQPLSVPPLVTVPGNQATVEGSPLVFSAATGRLIRIDDPDIGASPLVVDLTAFAALGGLAPSLTLASTSGLTSITGNGTNVLRLEGALANINTALANLTFYSADNGDFTVTVTATDFANSEADSASLQVQAANAAPQIVFTSSGGNEGSIIVGTLHVFDPGVVDDPQVSWMVSRDGLFIAQGVGPSVEFFAAEDGVYQVTATAVDKDGGVSTLSADVLVENASPAFELTGFIRDGVAHLTLVMKDPGTEQFTVDVFWTLGSSTPETFITSERTLTRSHQYTPEELALAGADLGITVFVFDGEDVERQTLNFREGAPPEVSPPKFEAAPPVTPPERLPLARLQPTSTTPQIVPSDLGRSATQGRPEEAAIQQFVLRVVGPDGEESADYALPADALENLPAFLTTLGVPDGHYRIYLVTGELDRLIIDAHLRGGRMIDPRDESQPTIDRPPASDDAAQFASANALHGASTTIGAANDPAPAPIAEVELATVSMDPHLRPDADGDLADDQVNSLLPLLGSTIVVGAAAVGFASMRAPTIPAREARRGFPRFTKAARWARKLKRSQ
ncbi:MAG: hypothetical protein WD894_26305 [Pirellulales bacterium]